MQSYDDVEDIAVDEDYYATALDGKTVEEWMQRELLHSKSALNDVAWGKRVTQGVDLDDVIKIAHLMDRKHYPSANINLQITTRGYAEYLWTPRIHEFLGDTALHMALRQKKLFVTYMLLYLGADPLIANARGITAAELCMSQFHTSYQNLKFDAKRKILEKINPLRWKELPADFYCRHTEEEAWRLMRAGRVLYTELPKALHQEATRNVNTTTVISHNARKRLSFNLTFFKPPDPPKKRRERPQDVKLRKRQEYLAVMEKAALESKLKRVKRAKYDPWKKLQAEDGSEYFYNEETGESAWEKPAPTADDDGDEEGNHLTNSGGNQREPTQEELDFEAKKKEHEEYALEVHRRLLDYYKLIEHKESNLQSHNLETGYTEGGIYHPPTVPVTEKKPLKLLVNDVWNRGTIEDILKLIRQQQLYHQSLKRRRAQHVHLRRHHPHHQMVNPLQDGAIGQTQLDRLQYYHRLISGMVPSYDNLSTTDLYQAHAHYPSTHSEEDQKLILGKFASLQEIFRTMHGLEKLSLVVKNVTLPTNSAAGSLSSKKDDKSKGNKKINEDRQSALGKLSAFAFEEQAKWAHDQQRVEEHQRMTTKKQQQQLQSHSPPQHHHHPHVHLHHRPVRILSTFHNLRFMQIGDSGVIALCEALQHNELIHSLILAHARMTDTATIAIKELLHTKNETLTYLDLSGNAITSDGAKVLADAIFRRQFKFSNVEQRKMRERQRQQAMLDNYDQFQASPFASPMRSSMKHASNHQRREGLSTENSLLVLDADSSSSQPNPVAAPTTSLSPSPTSPKKKATFSSHRSFFFSEDGSVGETSDSKLDPASEEIVTLMKAPVHRLNLMGNRITLEGALSLLESVLQYNRRIYEANKVFAEDDKSLLEKERLQDRYHRGGIDWINLSNNALSPRDYEALAKWMEEHDYGSADGFEGDDEAIQKWARQADSHWDRPSYTDDDSSEEKSDSEKEADRDDVPISNTGIVGVTRVATIKGTRIQRRHRHLGHVASSEVSDASSRNATKMIRVFQHYPKASLESAIALEQEIMPASSPSWQESTLQASLPPLSSPSQKHTKTRSSQLSRTSFGGLSSPSRKPWGSFSTGEPIPASPSPGPALSAKDAFFPSFSTGYSGEPGMTSPSSILRADHRRLLSTRSVKEHLHASLHSSQDQDQSDNEWESKRGHHDARGSNNSSGSEDSYSISVYSDEVESSDEESRLGSETGRFQSLQQEDLRKQWRPALRFPVILL
jgi:hypothetical protein